MTCTSKTNSSTTTNSWDKKPDFLQHKPFSKPNQKKKKKQNKTKKKTKQKKKTNKQTKQEEEEEQKVLTAYPILKSETQ